MRAVGRGVRMEKPSLHVRKLGTSNAIVLLDLKVMVSRVAKISMNARRRQLVNVLNATAKIPGEITSAPAVEIFCTSRNMTLA